MDPGRHRVLYIEKPVFVGGSVISLFELIRGLDTHSYEPVVLFHGPNPYRERFRALGVRVLTLSERVPATPSEISERDIAANLSSYSRWLATIYCAAKDVYLTARRDLPLAWHVAHLIRREAIDLVHHNNCLPEDRATVMAAWLAGVPQVCHIRTLHGFSFIERYLAHSVSSFIYISRAVEECYRNQGIPASKGQVVFNPIDTNAFARTDHVAGLRAEMKLTDQHRLISNVGRLDWWKGQDYFLQAMAQVIRTQPNAKALIVGESDSTPQSLIHFQRLQGLVRDLHLSDHVIFTGFRTDIPRIMAASDVVVHSASEPEPFGRTIVEAMAAGRPVVATAAGGVLDIVEDKITGLLVPPKDATSMAQAIEQLLQNQERAKIMGQRAQQSARERFSRKQHAAGIDRIYRKVLGSKKAP